tara:strand:- start:15408 stop:16712 length:1305 start_codon:yes stop_codon:yes gene_type:complete
MTAELTKTTWKEVRKKVKQVNQPLFDEIEDLAPDDSIPFYLGKYGFGDHIMLDGSLGVPDDKGNIISLRSSGVDKTLVDDLDYAPNLPIGLVTKNTAELYYMSGEQIVPWIFMYPGRIFSLWGGLQPPGTSAHAGKIWQVTAGARSIFMLPKIEEKRGYVKLEKEFGIGLPVPKKIFDQWHLYRDILQSPGMNSDWHTEIVLFSRSFREKLDTKKYLSLKNYLFETAWLDTSFLRDQVVFETVFSSALYECNLKPHQYLVDTAKHIYKIAQGAYVGFSFADSNLSAPIDELQSVFNNVYGHLKSAPTFMQPSYINTNQSIYYSLNIPTLLLFSLYTKYVNNRLNDLNWIKTINTKINQLLTEDKYGLGNSPIGKTAQTVDFEYIHYNPGEYNNILQAKSLAKQHAVLSEQVKSFNKPFCDTSKFWQGAIQLTKR